MSDQDVTDAQIATALGHINDAIQCLTDHLEGRFLAARTYAVRQRLIETRDQLEALT